MLALWNIKTWYRISGSRAHPMAILYYFLHFWLDSMKLFAALAQPATLEILMLAAVANAAVKNLLQALRPTAKFGAWRGVYAGHVNKIEVRRLWNVDGNGDGDGNENGECWRWWWWWWGWGCDGDWWLVTGDWWQWLWRRLVTDVCTLRMAHLALMRHNHQTISFLTLAAANVIAIVFGPFCQLLLAFACWLLAFLQMSTVLQAARTNMPKRIRRAIPPTTFTLAHKCVCVCVCVGVCVCFGSLKFYVAKRVTKLRSNCAHR